MKEDLIPISLRIPRELKVWLRDESVRRGTSETALVRGLIEKENEISRKERDRVG